MRYERTLVPGDLFGEEGSGFYHGGVVTHTCIYCQMVIALYKKGLSLCAVGAKVGVNQNFVRKILIYHGVERRSQGPRPRPAQWFDDVMTRREEGATLQQIGDAVGVTREYVRQVLVARGIDVRATRRRHTCSEVCDAVKAAPHPVVLRELSLRFPLARLGRALRHHPAPVQRGTQHVCGAGCATVLRAITEGCSMSAASREAGRPPNYCNRLRSYHPGWPWPRREWWLRGKVDVRS